MLGPLLHVYILGICKTEYTYAFIIMLVIICGYRGLKSYLELTGDGSTFASPEILQQVQDLIQKTTAVEKQFIISKGRDSGPRLFGSKSNIQQTTLAKPNDGAKLDESKAKPVIATETIATDARATCDDDNDDDGNTNKTQSQTSEASGTVTRECLDSYLEDISKRCRTILKELRISIPI